MRIVDTTLRDGEQKAGIALKPEEKIQIAQMLDKLGIFQIEAGTPAMGGDEKKSIVQIACLDLKSKISVWNRMSISDIQHSIDCRPDIIHISVPSSDIQIKSKLGKDRNWIIENLKRCIYYAKVRGFEITIGLEDASRADFRFLMQLIGTAFLEGVDRIRYADTVGILYMGKIYEEITEIRLQLDIDIEFHGHNDLGMAVANSISAAKAGACYVDCTMGGIGERAGNCNFIQFIKAAAGTLGIHDLVSLDLEEIIAVEKDILTLIFQDAPNELSHRVYKKC